MNILALDTSADRAVLGLAIGSNPALVAVCDGSRRRGRDLIPAVGDLLRRGGIRPRDLDLVGAGLGPGSYTGIRIGLTAARTLAFAVGAKVAGFDSLEAFALAAPAEAPMIRVVGDAQRGDVYRADFRRAAPGAPLEQIGPTRVESRDAWAASLRPGAWIAGPGLDSDSIRALLPPGVIVLDPEHNRLSGRALLDLTRRALETEPSRDPRTLEPNYLRRSAAEEQWDARGKL